MDSLRRDLRDALDGVHPEGTQASAAATLQQHPAQNNAIDLKSQTLKPVINP
jgi:hypothetical protein